MTDPTRPATPASITQWIGHVLRRKRELLDALHGADLDARTKRLEADKAEAHCYMTADGSIPTRQAAVDLDPVVRRARDEADVAEALVKHLQRMVTHCGDEIDAARTAAASVRAELSTLGYQDAS